MVAIYYHLLPENYALCKYKHLLEQMPEDVQKRYERYRQNCNKLQLIAGRKLLLHGMKKSGFTDFDLSAIFYNKYRCPIWSGNASFSITHSQQLVACAISDEGAVGLDVEKRIPVDWSSFKYILNKEDEASIRNSPCPVQTFFEIWTTKEALTKAMQMGLSVEVQPILMSNRSVSLEGNSWDRFSPFLTERYVASLVTVKNATEPEVFHLKKEDFI